MLIGSLTGVRDGRAVIHDVSPRVRRREHHRRGGRRPLGIASERVGLVPPHPVEAADRVLVPGAVGHARDEQLPHARHAERAHRERAAVPVVEVAGHAHPAGVRRPDREGHPGHLVDLADVRAQDLPQLLVPALPDQVEVVLAELRQEPVRILGHRLVRIVLGVRGGDAVVGHLLVGEGDREHALVQVGHRHPAVVIQNQFDRTGQGPQRPDHDSVRPGVRAEDRVRVVVLSGDEPLELAQADFSRAEYSVMAASRRSTPGGWRARSGGSWPRR